MTPVTPVTPSTAHRLLAVLARAQTRGRVPSLVAGIARDGRLVWAGGYGDVPGEPADVQYKIGSITKTLTAVLVLQLVEEGLLDLDDTLGSVLGDVGYADRTVRQLLAHDGGLQAEPDGSWWERSEGGDFSDLVEANDGARAASPAQLRYHYSNLAYGLLGEVVARLRDATWWECVEERLLGPLGMDRTSYHAEGPHARGWSVHPYARTLIAEPSPDTGAMAPAGQLWSTLGDLATWTGFLLDGHRDVLGADLLEQAFTPQAGDAGTGLAQAHGLGFQMFAGGSGTLVGHTGSMPGFHAVCLVGHRHRTAALALVNATAGVDVVGLASELLEELEAHEPSLPPAWRPNQGVPSVLGELLGTWHWGATPYVFALEGSELVATRDGVVKWRFGLDGDRVVGTAGHHRGEELTVVRRPDGSVAHLDVRTFVLTREPYSG